MENKTREEVEKAAEEKYPDSPYNDAEGANFTCEQKERRTGFIAGANWQLVENNSAVWVKLIDELNERADSVDAITDYDKGKMIGLNAAANIVRKYSAGASQPTIDSIRVQAAKDRHNLEEMTKDRDYWKALAEKCIAEHPIIVEGL